MKIHNVFGNVYRGTIGDCITASAWKGIDYLRKWFVPTNPMTTMQIYQREIFADAVDGWQGLTPEQKYVYDRLAVKMSGFNLFVKRYIEIVRAGQTYAPAIVIEIPVVDDKGKPVKGAVVKVMRGSKMVYEAIAGDDGKCTIALTYEDEPYEVIIEKMGYRMYRLSHKPISEFESLTFELQKRTGGRK